MSLTDLKNHIKSGEFAPLYLFAGEESYLMRHYLSLVKGKLLNGFEDMDLSVFDGKKTVLSDFDEAVCSFPFAASRKLVVIKDLSLAKSNEIVSYLAKEGVPESATVIVYEEAPAVAASSDEAKRFAKDTGAVVCSFDPLKESEQTDWIIRYFAAAKKNISRQNAELIVSYLPAVQDLIKNECDKLISRCERNEIRREDIVEMIVPSVDSKGWQLSAAIVNNDVKGALKLIDDLYVMKTEESVIAASVYRAYSDMLAVKTAVLSGKNPAAAESFTKLKPFVCQKYAAAVKDLPLSYFSKCLSDCLECDRDLKSKSIDKRARIETLIVKASVMRNER
jgi:DNA polymerase-3 subunit delta